VESRVHHHLAGLVDVLQHELPLVQNPIQHRHEPILEHGIGGYRLHSDGARRVQRVSTPPEALQIFKGDLQVVEVPHGAEEGFLLGAGGEAARPLDEVAQLGERPDVDVLVLEPLGDEDGEGGLLGVVGPGRGGIGFEVLGELGQGLPEGSG
jgi:hypothetical protein